jgi:hypothetical protein
MTSTQHLRLLTLLLASVAFLPLACSVFEDDDDKTVIEVRNELYVCDDSSSSDCRINELVVREVKNVENGTIYFASSNLTKDERLSAGDSLSVEVSPGQYYVGIVCPLGTGRLMPDELMDVQEGERWRVIWDYDGLHVREP